MKLNNSSLTPLYQQLKQTIHDDIMKGKYEPGSQLPTEPEICETYGVSRITARRAILDLVDEGILSRQQGKGTFVADTRVERELISINGFSDFSQKIGKKPTSQIIETKIIDADNEIKQALNVNDKTPILHVHRLLLTDKNPFVLQYIYFPLSLFPNLDKHITDSVSTYSILKNYYGSEPFYNEKTLEVVHATRYVAELLKCKLGLPVYEVETVAYNQEKIPIHFTRSLFPTNRVKFTISSMTQS